MKTITEYINESLNESLTTSKSEITRKISAWLPGDIICFDKDERSMIMSIINKLIRRN